MLRVNLHSQIATLLIMFGALGCAGIDASIDVALSAPSELDAAVRVHLWELDPTHLTHEAKVVATRDIMLEDETEQLVEFDANLDPGKRYYFTAEQQTLTSCVVYRDVEDAQLFEGDAPPGQIDLRLSAAAFEDCLSDE